VCLLCILYDAKLAGASCNHVYSADHGTVLAVCIAGKHYQGPIAFEACLIVPMLKPLVARCPVVQHHFADMNALQYHLNHATLS